MSLHDLPFFPVSGGSEETGKDGISPTITVTEIEDGHKLTIVDVTGTKSIDIKNGTEADSVLYTEQNLTKEQQAKARENIGAAIEIYDIVSPEMFGAVGDGVTDDSAAFIEALSNGKKVVCMSDKTYYFANPVDVRTLKTGHLDGNNAYFINFHLYVNINDTFNDWKYAYPSQRFVVENMNFGYKTNGWSTLPEGWETPLITTGLPMIIKNINTAYPYVLATVDEYIDYMLCDGWILTMNPDLFKSYELNLDAISCLNKNGEYCRFNTTKTPSAAGDSWRIVQCNEFSLTQYPDYKMMEITARQPLYVDSCVQSSFVIDKYAKVLFTGCHWESKSGVTFKSNYLVTAKFIQCFFYNNYILNDNASTTYDNCFFRASVDAVMDYPLSHMTGNKSFYELHCNLISCKFGGNSYIDSNELINAKQSPKKTYNKSCSGGYRTKLSEKTLDIRSHSNNTGQFFPSAGDYTYDIYLRTTSLPNVAADYAQKTISITDIDSTYISLQTQYMNGGCSLLIFRTDPNGNIEKTEFYSKPNAFDKIITKLIETVTTMFLDYGSFANFSLESINNGTYVFENEVVAPWVPVSEKPTITINELLYEANGALVTLDNSDANLDKNGSIQVGCIDTELISTSEHPVQNKVIFNKFATIEQKYGETLYGLSYKLPEEKVFTGESGQQIITTVKLFDEPKDFTIFVDASPSADNYISNLVLLDASQDSGYKGGIVFKTNASWNKDGFRVCGLSSDGGSELTSVCETTERTKMAVVFKQGVFDTFYFIKNSDSSVSAKKIWSGWTYKYPQHNGVVIIGSNGNGGERFNGTIHSVEIYNYAFTEEAVNERLTSDDYKPAGLSAVAISGSYNSLIDKPEIPSIEGLATESYVDEKLDNKMNNITITPEDEGKFLMIQGGTVALVTIPNITEEVF